MSASTFKLIALVTMIIDHIGGVLLPQYYFLRIIGRIAFPIYAFFIAKGFQYTKNPEKYLFRLLIFLLISEIPFDICFNSYYTQSLNLNINFFNMTNTIYTLFLGGLSIFIIQEVYKLNVPKVIKILINITCVAIIFFIAEEFKTDYGMWGVTLILLFYIFRNNKIIMLFSTFILILGKYLLYINFNYYMLFFNILPLLLIYFYNNKKGFNLKYLFYIMYPAHLLIIGIIKIIIEIKYFNTIN